ncbi:hypothetical protein [Variovorax sp. OV329]|uniref:hypothetical protein n=1 Tax=Variovorax sp. OV329 TaxID=1882825 RepID=UPI0011143D05|nr:hypothetical protein [Variovorax sp. OV329]
MKLVGSVTVIASLVLAGCAGTPQTEVVEVRITPDAYQVGSVRSTLATPVVDEVVRRNPQRVLMVMCRATPPAKIIQFQTELRARNKAEIQGTHTTEGCPGQFRSA